MVGAAYHVACLRPPNPASPVTPCVLTDDNGPLEYAQMVNRLADDNLSPLIHRLCFYDLLAMFSPVNLRDDRGHGLEAGWQERLAGALNVSFRRLARGEQEGWRPSLVFSPMFVEDGRRLLISNLDLAEVARTEWRAIERSADGQAAGLSWSLEGVEFFKLFPDAERFRLSTAARMSASFPYISPAAVLPTVPRRRVVDAGYYDNYGVNLAVTWLHGQRDWLRQHASKVVLIHIRDGLDEDARRDLAVPPDSSSALTRGLEWFSSPPEGALTARSSVMAYRNDEQLELLSAGMMQEFGDNFFLTALLENQATVSMSWYVTPEELALMRHAIEPDDCENQERLRHLARWWHG
jgi:hypothetical protein